MGVGGARVRPHGLTTHAPKLPPTHPPTHLPHAPPPPPSVGVEHKECSTIGAGLWVEGHHTLNPAPPVAEGNRSGRGMGRPKASRLMELLGGTPSYHPPSITAMLYPLGNKY